MKEHMDGKKWMEKKYGEAKWMEVEKIKSLEVEENKLLEVEKKKNKSFK